jgi:hypothetical protein
MLWLAVSAVFTGGALLVSGLPARSSTSSATVVGPDAVPPAVASQAVALAQDRYGPVVSTYGEAASTLGNWAKVEPMNTEGLGGRPPNEPVYAVFLKGDFVVESPFGYQTRYSAGRIVVDGNGRLLLLSLWHDVAPVETGFSADFDH